MLLFFHTEDGTPEAVYEAARKHVYLGLVIILAGVFKAAEVLWRRRFKWIAFPWIALLFLAALMLITYLEPAGAYKTMPLDQPDTTRLLAPQNINCSFHFHTGGASMRRTIAFLLLLLATALWAACTTADNTNSNTNTAVTAPSPTGTGTPSNANVHANMNASEHANMNMGNKNANAKKTP